MLGIFAICDSGNNEVKSGLKPLMIGFLLWGIGLSFGFNCGYAVNPARDFAPRIFTAMAGYGKDVFVCVISPVLCNVATNVHVLRRVVQGLLPEHL